jgi:Na+-translocating ferredoxin:NAD+ oxidoreductase RnfD subunit
VTAAHALRVGGREYPVAPPSIRDPKIQLASVIVSVQILGQTVLGFHLSIAQILVSLITCAAIEMFVVLRRSASIVWPGSALLTGNGIALILRVPGTEHGDWWSFRGWYYFAGVAAFAMLTKYLIRYRGGHVFNPSNVALVAAFLVLGSDRVEPLDFWWGPFTGGVVAATVLIVVGGIVITHRLELLGMAVGFWVTFAASLAVVAAAGHCMTATWRFGPICGASFWWVLVTSPEVLIFLFFMITDPRTTPSGRVARIAFGVGVGFLAALLVAPQETEFSSKVAVLGSLVVMCVARYPLARMLPAAGSVDDSLRVWIRSVGTRPRPTEPVPAFVPYATLVSRPVGIGSLSAIVIGIGVAVLVAASTPARDADATVRADGGTGSRVLVVDPADLPPVTISAEMRRINPELEERTALLMAADVLAALEAERRALLTGDLEVGAFGATLVRLDDLAEQVDRVRAGHHVPVPQYVIESMQIVPVHDPRNAQSGPQFGVEMLGSIAHDSEAPEPYERTFALFLHGDRYLIAADYPPGG